MKSLFERGRAHLSLVEPRPDFSSVTTPAKAAALSDTGKLKRMLLVPVALGGEDADTNAAYVPPAVVVVQERLNETLRRYLSEGRIDNLSVDPEYKGKSLVPTRIRVSARKDGRAGEFTTVIGIW
ncbi:MAG: hypothetical protein JWN73_1741 [Betaproteobacteria bacterium]|nr:hypothetical protein [Betaproteobacteria bacterium]